MSNMNNKPTTHMLAGALLALALTVPMAMGSSYSQTRTGTAPGSATLEDVVSAGIALCTNTLGGPIDCTTGSGVGGAFFEIGSTFNDPTGTDPNSVSGTCSVTKILVPVNQGKVEFMCGVDRDLDGSVTNIDPVNDDTGGSGIAGAPCNTVANPATDDPNDFKAAADCGYDDMGWVGLIGPTAADNTLSLNVCFSRGTDSTVSGANGDYSDVVVFLGGSTPGVPVTLTDFYIGTISIDLSLADTPTSATNLAGECQTADDL